MLSRGSAKRLSRARAGSPEQLPEMRGIVSALPRTRGFTSRIRRRISPKGGSPAHARVHRGTSRPAAYSSRLSRARAGSPSSRTIMSAELWALPRTRGFTDRRRPEFVCSRGSPAHARVHRLENGARSRRRRLSRARAGSPIRPPLIPRIPSALPRTRGFTVSPGIVQMRITGSPAHARVHRRRSCRPRSCCRLSRARAGSPSAMRTPSVIVVALPRTRGFTVRARRLEAGDRGSPAHARVHRPK